MQFNSYTFIFIFLPLAVGMVGILKRKCDYRVVECFISIASLVFCGVANIRYAIILLFSVLINYCLYRFINKRYILNIGIIINILGLAYFKYAGFFVDSINRLFSTDIVFVSVIVPLGISFYTFHQISFLIDAYRGEVKDATLLDCIFYITYFPKLSMGPIVRYNELVPQVKEAVNSAIDWKQMTRGLYLFALGLGKKILIADTFGAAVDWAYTDITLLNSPEALFTVFAYTMQIYFDFSGYCDMGRGISKMLGFELPLNFNSPYKASTITEYWDRWHITLTKFFTKYLYIPLGGNRKGTIRTYVNVMIVFLVSGLWHGAAWTFVLWGAIHGVFTVITKAGKKAIDNIPKWINWCITFVVVNFAWVFFRADSFAYALKLFERLFSFSLNGRFFFEELQNCFKLTEFKQIPAINRMPYSGVFFMLAFSVLAIYLACISPNAGELADKRKIGPLMIVESIVLLVICILHFAGMTTYIYQYF